MPEVRSLNITMRQQSFRSGTLKERGIFASIMLLLFAGFGLYQPAVYSIDNIGNILVQASYLCIFAAAQSLVITTRGFDLSLGATISTVSVLTALAMTGGAGPGAVAVGLGVALIAGAGIGSLNGMLVSYGRINPFIATLGVMYILMTAASTISNGFPVTGLPDEFLALAYVRVAGLPLSFICAIGALVLLQLALSKTVFGRTLMIIGSNPRAARAAGMAHRFHLFSAYLICGVLVGLGAFLLTARTSSGEPNLGGNLTLEAIAAAVLGGMRLRGGSGDMLAPLLGALFVTILSNGTNLAGAGGYTQQILLGVVIIAALLVDSLRSRQLDGS